MSIFYVEPNDIIGRTENGNPITPDYTDLSMSCNLIIDITNRYSQIGDVDKQYILTWSSRPNDTDPHGHGSKLSILQGSDIKDYNYLTTYYTDVNHQHIVENNTVEGLGVKSVEISYDNYYMPTVTIQFVDVLGSALYEREEAIHHRGKLTSDNIFGTFFTQPYPKFRLQVKGFYGDAVTYQLMCSGFNGRFDSQNGSFEATATFIGYNYSLLTDIPFDYLISAPYSSYFGRDYWAKMESSSDWALSDGGKARKLFDLFLEVKKAQLRIEHEADSYVSREEEDELQRLTENKRLIDNILQAASAFEEEYSKSFENPLFDGIMQGNQTSIRIIVPKDNKPRTDNKFSSLLQTLQQNFRDALAAYESKNGGTPIVSDDLNLGKWGSKAKQNQDIYPMLRIDKTKYDGIYQFVNNQITNANLRSTAYNCYILSLGLLAEHCKAKVAEIDARIQEIEDYTRNKLLQDYNSSISVKPFVGDIVKIVMCHLETLIQMFNHCGSVIDGSKATRTPSAMNINLDMTEIVTDSGANKNFIAPWPGIYDNSPRENNPGSTNAHTWLWLGDVSPNEEEVKMVRGMMEAQQMLVNLSSALLDPNSTLAYDGIPLLPYDFNGNPFTNVSTDLITTSGLCGQIGVRLSQLLNLGGMAKYGESTANELMRLFGEVDAINISLGVGDTTLLRTQALEPLRDNGGLYNTLKPIISCTEEGDRYASTTKAGPRHSFEINNSSSRNKIINDSWLYVWMSMDNPKLSHFAYFIPLPLEQFNTINKKGVMYEDGRIVSIGNTLAGTSSLIPLFSTSEDFKNVVDPNIQYTVSNNAFRIDMDGSEYAKRIFDFLTSIHSSEGSIKLKDGTTFNMTYDKVKDLYLTELEDISPMWDVKMISPPDVFDEKFTANKSVLFMQNAELHLYARLIGRGKYRSSKKDFKLFVNSEDVETNPKELNGDSSVMPIGVTHKSHVESDGTEKKTTEGLSVKFTPYLTVNDQSRFNSGKIQLNNESGSGHNSLTFQSLFGSKFYYSLNLPHATDNLTQDLFNIPDGAIVDKVHQNRRKAFLFVHTLECNLREVFLNLNKFKGSSISFLPIPFVLIVGANLYRHRVKTSLGIDIFEKRTAIPNDVKLPPSNVSLLAYYEGFGINEEVETIGTALMLTNNHACRDIGYKIDVISELRKSGFTDSPIVENAFINEFLNFADNMYQEISNEMELRLKRPVSINGITTDVFLPECLDKLVESIERPKSQTEGYYMFSMDDSYTFSSKGADTSASTVDVRPSHPMSTPFSGPTVPNERNIMSLVRPGFYEDFVMPMNGKYSIISVFSKVKTLYLQIHDESKMQDFYRNIYGNVAVVSNTYAYTLWSAYTTTERIGSMSDIYIKSLSDKLNTIVGLTQDGQIIENTNYNKDLANSMYADLKNIWDKWIVGMLDPNQYNVSKFFKDDFIFIDSFYKNIYRRFLLNYNKVIESYLERRQNNMTLYSFLGDIASDHNMLFLAMPDFNNIGHEDDNIAQANLEKTFLPIPYNKMSNVEDNNKFVFLYTHRPSSSVSSVNGGNMDTYNIWDYESKSLTPIAGRLFNTDGNENMKDQITRNGYNVPSFGVSMSRQHNHLFKSINVNSNNPIQTEQSAHVMAQIANLGASTTNKTSFYGQDIFPIFSNYSFESEIEMMGCAKIAPLMYYQLMNVGMWRGTYMIFNVRHTISPGNFITKFKGMKMSAKAIPYNTNFIYTPEGSTGISSGMYELGFSSHMSAGFLNSSYPRVNPRKDYFSDPNNRKGDVVINGAQDNLRNLYNSLFEAIRVMNENKPPEERWGILLTSVMRKGNSQSQHYYGEAMDIKIAKYKDGYDSKPEAVPSGELNQPQLLTVMDMILSNHFGSVRQLILERLTGQGVHQSDSYKYLVLHVGVHTPRTEGKATQVFLSNINKGATANIARNMSDLAQAITPEFKAIAYKYYDAVAGNPEKFNNVFTNFNFARATGEDLSNYFKGMSSTNMTTTVVSNQAPQAGLTDASFITPGFIQTLLILEGWSNGFGTVNSPRTMNDYEKITKVATPVRNPKAKKDPATLGPGLTNSTHPWKHGDKVEYLQIIKRLKTTIINFMEEVYKRLPQARNITRPEVRQILFYLMWHEGPGGFNKTMNKALGTEKYEGPVTEEIVSKLVSNMILTEGGKPLKGLKTYQKVLGYKILGIIPDAEERKEIGIKYDYINRPTELAAKIHSDMQKL